MKIFVSLHDEDGKRTNTFHQIHDYEAQEFGGTGTTLKHAPFKPGHYYYPIEITMNVLQRLGDDFFGKDEDGQDFEIEDVCAKFEEWQPHAI